MSKRTIPGLRLNGGSDVSIFSKIGKAFKKVVPKEIRALAPALLPAIPGLGPVLGGVARVAGVVGATRAASQAMPGAMATMSALPSLSGVAAAGRGLIRALPGAGAAGVAAGRAVIAGGRALVRKYPRSARALAELGLFAAGGVVFDMATGQPVGVVRRHRMNPLNHRALRRAISRVKSAKKICAQVERIAGPRRRAAPCPPRGRKC